MSDLNERICDKIDDDLIPTFHVVTKHGVFISEHETHEDAENNYDKDIEDIETTYCYKPYSSNLYEALRAARIFLTTHFKDYFIKLSIEHVNGKDYHTAEFKGFDDKDCKMFWGRDEKSLEMAICNTIDKAEIHA